jgi:hypothetical protein
MMAKKRSKTQERIQRDARTLAGNYGIVIGEENATSKLCSMTLYGESIKNLYHCVKPGSKTCKMCDAGFCDEHARGSMVGDLCVACNTKKDIAEGKLK